MRGKKSQVSWKIFQDTTCWLFLTFETVKKCTVRARSTTTATVGIVTSEKVSVRITMNHRFQCFTSAAGNLQLTAKFVSVSCPVLSPCLELHHSLSKTCCPQALHMPAMVYNLSLFTTSLQVFKKNGCKPQEIVSLLITVRADRGEASPGPYPHVVGNENWKDHFPNSKQGPRAEPRVTQMQSEKLEYVYRFPSF